MQQNAHVFSPLMPADPHVHSLNSHLCQVLCSAESSPRLCSKAISACWDQNVNLWRGTQKIKDALTPALAKVFEPAASLRLPSHDAAKDHSQMVPLRPESRNSSTHTCFPYLTLICPIKTVFFQLMTVASRCAHLAAFVTTTKPLMPLTELHLLWRPPKSCVVLPTLSTTLRWDQKDISP